MHVYRKGLKRGIKGYKEDIVGCDKGYFGEY